MARIHDKNVVQYLPPSQVEKLIRHAEQQAYERGYMDGHNYAASNLMKYRDILEQMKLSLVHVDTLWSMPKAPGDFMRQAMRGKDDLLDDQWSAFINQVLTMDPAPPPEQLERFGHIKGLYVTAIKLFLNGNDDGEMLIALAEEKPANHPIRQLRAFADTINLGGAPSGMQSWRRRLGEMIIELERRSPSYSYDRLGRIIRSRLEDTDNRTPDEDIILERLSREKYNDPQEMKRYIRDVRRDYLGEFDEL